MGLALSRVMAIYARCLVELEIALSRALRCRRGARFFSGCLSFRGRRMADEPQQALDNHYATAADTRFLGRGGHVRRFAGEYGGVLLPHIGRCLGVQAAVRPCVRRASCLGR